MPTYIWAAIGLILIISEMVAPTFFLIFLGIGALCVAASTSLGWTASIETQLLVFTVVSVVLMILFRGKFKKTFSPKDIPPDYMNKIVDVTQDISPNRDGSVSYRGSEWIAFADEEIKKDRQVTIIGKDGIRLKVKAVDK